MRRRFIVYVSLTLLITLTTVSNLMAQPSTPPCDPEDTSPECVPLDTWVFVLAFGMLILTAIYLHRKEGERVKAL